MAGTGLSSISEATTNIMITLLTMGPPEARELASELPDFKKDFVTTDEAEELASSCMLQAASIWAKQGDLNAYLFIGDYLLIMSNPDARIPWNDPFEE